MQVELIYYSDIDTKKYEEHLVYTFYITDFSRAVLQELSRHRMASLSVKSTRYVLSKELKDEPSFITFHATSRYPDVNPDRAEKYIVMTGVWRVDYMSILALESLRELVSEGISNDKLKYAMPECFKTSLAWTINARSLQNFLSLRSDKSALWEIQKLAHAVYDALPTEHKYLFEDHIKNS